ncbi:E3 ubiquitin-protein ligase JMJ24 isoform X1 [Coffea arabica]|uniref:E3 ubiquitin-protein ligase JMJ24 isoform X1 n=1 Tax=Coffea arabica TaxID=13443 RepID=A0A6P6VRR0_COFAR|nr:lysine-specific demethylase JMJ25 isoform X1 [Coffea arabica]
MDHSRSIAGAGEDNVGIPDDLRCKRSDGKQWRCTAMSMPDKTVCEKHYIQAKKRAANSALKASMKKKRKPIGESDNYYESKSDDMDVPLVNSIAGDYSGSVSGKKNKEKLPKTQRNYSPEAPSTRSLTLRSSLKSNDELQRDGIMHEDNRRSYKTPPPPTIDSSRSRSQKMFDSSPMTETSEGSSESSDDTGGQPCHQCRRNDRDRVIWCLKCDRRGYCDICISTWYSDIPVEEIQRVCPACRGSCSCKVCLRGDNLIKAKIREIPIQDKLQYLYCLLSAVLPVVNQIHHEQNAEVELEKRLHGNIDLARTKLNADEQMCCNFCRIPVIDYHRHCPNCLYDLCLSCCKDIREASRLVVEVKMENQIAGESNDRESALEQVELSNVQLNLLRKYSGWRAQREGNIRCPPREYGGCGCSSLVLKRIFKMNWVAKLVKNAEEMVGGCRVYDSGSEERTGFDLRLFQAAHRENDSDNCLYHPSAQDIKTEGIGDFRIHWSRGEPVIVKEVCDTSLMTIWDPEVLLRGIRETAEEKLKDANRTVKAIDCFNWTEQVDIELSQFIKGYSEGRFHENGRPETLKLKDWPSPSSSEEFLMYQRPDFIIKLPLLEFIHSKWGLLNVAAKLPHYSLQNDVGPKIQISYGTCKELDRGDSVEKLRLNMRDVVFLLVHVSDAKLERRERTKVEKVQKTVADSETREPSGDPQMSLNGDSLKSLTSGQDRLDENQDILDPDNYEAFRDQHTKAASPTEEETVSGEDLNVSSDNNCESSQPGALWDVFRLQDVPKLIEYLKVHKEFETPDRDGLENDFVRHPLYDGTIYLNSYHKQKLKEEIGIEPWSFEQHMGEAVFIPAGCPFQVKNLQSTVQLGLDFLSPESLREALKLAEEIRGLPSDHDAKLQILEVGKISLYAASWAIKEVQKLVLDPKLGPELGFEDPNLTALVSKNLEEMVKRRQIPCV